MNHYLYAFYEILRILDEHNGDEAFDYRSISAEAMGMSFAPWERLMIDLQASGLIRGLTYTRDLIPHIVEPVEVQITLQGMEYLENNR